MLETLWDGGKIGISGEDKGNGARPLQRDIQERDLQFGIRGGLGTGHAQRLIAGELIGHQQNAKTDEQPQARQRQPLRPPLRLGMRCLILIGHGMIVRIYTQTSRYFVRNSAQMAVSQRSFNKNYF